MEGVTTFDGPEETFCRFAMGSGDVESIRTSSSSSVVLPWLWVLARRDGPFSFTGAGALIAVVAGDAGLTFALPAKVADAFRLLDAKERVPCFIVAAELPNFVFGAIGDFRKAVKCVEQR